jgi:hypothetical protein
MISCLTGQMYEKLPFECAQHPHSPSLSGNLDRHEHLFRGAAVT